MKKALIITYYWPPAGGSGVQRWLKFVKYFRDFNIEPVVYTADNPNYPIIDDSLKLDIPDNITVLKKPIWEPNSFFRRKNQESAGFLNPNPSLISKMAQYIRANWFIPDARKFWIKPSVNYLKKYLKSAHIDIVITTGPPHSLHLIGLNLTQQLPIKWIADFRDPWTEIDYFHQLPLTKKATRKHHKLEQEVLSNADAVLVVSDSMKEKYKKFNKCCYTVTNGFDGDLVTTHDTLDKMFSITHIGSMNADRNPKMLWEVLLEIIKENPQFESEFKLKLIGKADATVIKDIADFNLKKYVQIIGYVSHNEVIEYQKNTQALLLIVNDVPNAKGIITGKLFEYFMVQRPILAIAPTDGDLANIIEETNTGRVIGFNDHINLKKTILEMYAEYKKGTLQVRSKHIAQFHRRVLTEKVSDVIHTLVK